MQTVDVIIIGAGAAGLFCAIEAGKRNRTVLVLDHANKAGKKIIISGGGRCNFTNYYIEPMKYISHNPHFCKSSLSRYTQWDFIQLVQQSKIPFHEKEHGQLFCDNKSQDIVNMLLSECEKHRVAIRLNTAITSIAKENDKFTIQTIKGNYRCQSLVIATGGLSFPTMGASPFGYKIAEQFGIKVWPTRAGLVPLTLQPEDKQHFSELSGISINSLVECNDANFHENILFTHRGLSGPAILQISSYWHAGNKLLINLLPKIDFLDELKSAKQRSPHKLLKTLLVEYLPKRFVSVFMEANLAEQALGVMPDKQLEAIAMHLTHWSIKPNSTEGYRTAEVTLGGVDCNAVSSKTMAANTVPGLYFIGEVLDVTGWLGGYNFQWAWSSGWAAGQEV